MNTLSALSQKTHKDMSQLGAALGKLYAWNSSADIECLQVLLCTRLLANDDGYAELARVRLEIGIPMDRMTRCLRLLAGGTKSTSFLGGRSKEDQNVALIDITSYAHNQSVKIIGLTSYGREIISGIENIYSIKNEEIEALSSTKELLDRLGFITDISKIQDYLDSGNAVVTYRATALFDAIFNDLSKMSLVDLYNLNLPHLNKHLQEIPGAHPERNEFPEEANRHKGYSCALLNRLRKQGGQS